MTIQQEMAVAETALLTILSLIPFDTELKTLIGDTQKTCFEKILSRNDLSEKQKTEEIDIITMGIIISLLSEHQSRYKGIINKDDLASPYLCEKEVEDDGSSVPFIWDEETQAPPRNYPSWRFVPYYPHEYATVLKVSSVNINTHKENIVLAVGTKVMNRELPFEPETFKQILDKHTSHALSSFAETPSCQATFQSNIVALKTRIDETAIKINQAPQHYYTSFILNETVNIGYHAIEKIFHDALNTASASNENPDKKKFMDGLNSLKRETLANFTVKKSNFDFDNCTIIANAALSLATKVGSNTVTQADVEQFTNSTQKYKTCNMLGTTLAIIIGAVIGMIAGAAVGFVVGGAPGAIIGGVSGLVACGGIAGLSFTMWHTKNQPLNKISLAAIDIARQSQI